MAVPGVHPSRFIRETVKLTDGRKVVLRPIRPADADHLVGLHSRLSSESRYLRFFGPKPSLSDAEAKYLAGVDFTRRFAIVAVAPDDAIVAVGRFDLVEEHTAEPAIVVRDDYQGVGLGRTVLERMLEVARGRGVSAFAAEILAENAAMLHILQAAGLQVGLPDNGVVRVAAPVSNVPLVLRGLGLFVKSAEKIVEHVPPLKRPKAD